jgi:hypothetical protein
VKHEFEKITKEVNILIKNLEPIEGAIEGLQESLVAYEGAAKKANNPDGA